MNLKPKYSAIGVLGLCMVLALTGAAGPEASPPSGGLPGQSVTLLPNGKWLVLGGDGTSGAVTSASIWDPTSGTLTQLASSMQFARAGQTATVLGNGTVAILGGIGANGADVGTIESFNPQTAAFSSLGELGLAARADASATLMPNGEVLIAGGIADDGSTLRDAFVWSPATNAATPVAGGLAFARSNQTATLESDGTVLLEGGIGPNGQLVTAAEAYDPVQERFLSIASATEQNPSGSAQVASSVPANGSYGAPANTPISVLFSSPVEVTSANSNSITLRGPDGETLPAAVYAAEAGRLAFVDSALPLQLGATYTVTVKGTTDPNGAIVPTATVSFTVGSIASAATSLANAAASGSLGSSPDTNPEAWIPGPQSAGATWVTGRADSPWASLPPLRAKPGVTAVSGQVLKLNGEPLTGATLTIGNRNVLSNLSGRFLITGLSGGHQVLVIQGATANRPGKAYGRFEVGLNVLGGQTNVLSFKIWMPLLDTAHAVTIASPTRSETVVTNPILPGLALHIPAGTVIVDAGGRTVTTITITPVPLDRPPFPLPYGVKVPIYFTVQPGGAYLQGVDGYYRGARLFYPNLNHDPPGSPFAFWNYDADTSGWYIYGKGRVAADGQQIVPDPGVEVHEFSGAMVGGGLDDSLFAPTPQAPGHDQPPASDCCGAPVVGDPVSTFTGVLTDTNTDLYISDVIPISLVRTYNSLDLIKPHSFGVGATNNYDIFLLQDDSFASTSQCQMGNFACLWLILPDGSRIHYTNQSGDPTHFTDAHYTADANPTGYLGSTIVWNGNGWNMTLKDGTVIAFPDGSGKKVTQGQLALTSITDRYGNEVSVDRDPTTGNIIQITSPSGRWIRPTYNADNLIMSAADNSGRQVSYTYTSSNCTRVRGEECLMSVQDVNGNTTTYAYDGNNGLLTSVTDPRGNMVLKVSYFGNQQVQFEQVDGVTAANAPLTYQFTYNATDTVVTDPGGVTRDLFFNAAGYVTQVVDAETVNGQPNSQKQTTTYVRDPNTNAVTSLTDPLGRQTTYTYDGVGNLNTVSRNANTSTPSTTTYAYDTNVFNQITSIKDPNGNTTTLDRDQFDNLMGIVPPAPATSVAFAYNTAGQPTFMIDANNDIASFHYRLGDLVSIEDPDGGFTTRSTDALGRVIAVTDPDGNTTQYQYRNDGHLMQVTDPIGEQTQFTFDQNGNLTKVTDAAGNLTQFQYDAMNRLIQRIDALHASETYAYNVQFTDPTYGFVPLEVVRTYRNAADTSSYFYDPFGNLGHERHAVSGTNQEVIDSAYDGANRLQTSTDTNSGDGDGATWAINRSYDNLDDLTLEFTNGTTPFGSSQSTIDYGYDLAGRRSSMHVNPLTPVMYNYDNANRLTSITQGGTSVMIGYDNANRRQTVTLPNGVVGTYSYDHASRVTGLAYTLGSTTLGDMLFGYDLAGRMTSKSNVTGTLATLAATTIPVQMTATYNAANEISTYNGHSVAYDSDGGLTTDASGNQYQYYVRGHRMSQSTVSPNNLLFAYDGLGRRIQLGNSSTGAVKYVVYDGQTPVQEQSTNTANLLTGLGIDEYYTRTDSSGARTFLTDPLGSTVALTDSNGTIQTQYAYEPFGAVTMSGPQANANPYQFTGRENDSPLPLYYYRARYYSPTFSRFTTQDPIDFRGGDSNLYRYAVNNPLVLTDALGLSDLIFIRGTPTQPGVLLILSGNGVIMGDFPAGNITQNNNPFPSGTFPFQLYNSHSGIGDIVSYGSNGDFVFDVPGHQGLAVHSGRNNNVQSPTNGCIRTTDPATALILMLNNGPDPLQTLTVVP